MRKNIQRVISSGTLFIILVYKYKKKNMENNNHSEFVSFLNDNDFTLESQYIDDQTGVLIGFDGRYFNIPPYILYNLVANNLFDEHSQKLFLVRNNKLIEKLNERRAKINAHMKEIAEASIKETTGIEYEYIYFVKHNRLSPIKIGKTNSLERKIKDLNSASPYGITVLGYIRTSNGTNLLKTLFEIFLEYKLNADWFDISKDDIAELIKQYNKE